MRTDVYLFLYIPFVVVPLKSVLLKVDVIMISELLYCNWLSCFAGTDNTAGDI